MLRQRDAQPVNQPHDNSRQERMKIPLLGDKTGLQFCEYIRDEKSCGLREAVDDWRSPFLPRSRRSSWWWNAMVRCGSLPAR